MVTGWMRSGRMRVALAALVLVCTTVWGAEARAERRGIAVIIGNGEYEHRDIPPVDYAHRDAEAFKRYAIGMLGFAEANVIHLKDATRREMEDVLGEPGAVMNDLQARLNLLGGRDLEVLVYYSGHGVPGAKGQPYLLPVDVPPHAARREGYGVDALYQTLGKLHGVKSVRVFLDTCFSGSSHGGRLVKGSPVFVEPKWPEGTSEGMMVLTAVTKTQIATWDKKARHGLFTHHLLDALYGKGDRDGDGKVAAIEVKEYLDRVMTASAWLVEKREQQATLQGTGNEVLASAGPGGAFPKRPELEPMEARRPNPAAQPDPAPAAEPQWDHDAKRLIQTGLKELGFETGSPDGIFGPKTREAIRKWRVSKGLAATGQLDLEHGEALKAVGQAAERKKQGREAERRAQLERQRQERETEERERLRAEKERLAREAEARRQAELERQRLAREAAEREKREREAVEDQAAFDNARAVNTVAAYREYLSSKTNGAFREEARRRIVEVITNTVAGSTFSGPYSGGYYHRMSLSFSPSGGVELTLQSFPDWLSWSGTWRIDGEKVRMNFPAVGGFFYKPAVTATAELMGVVLVGTLGNFGRPVVWRLPRV